MYNNSDNELNEIRYLTISQTIWKRQKKDIRYASEHVIFSASPQAFGNYYISSYKCPYCTNAMYKTIFPVGEEYHILTDSKEVSHYMKRVFTCPQCMKFITAIDSKLSTGNFYEISFIDKNNYAFLLRMINEVSTTEGRPD